MSQGRARGATEFPVPPQTHSPRMAGYPGRCVVRRLEEKEYLTWASLYQVSGGRWNQERWDSTKAKTPEQAKALLTAELWVPANMKAWQKEQEEAYQRANPARHKRAIRWRKSQR